MPTILTPYLSFRDTARQAMEFYQTIFGGELALDTFATGMPDSDPAEADKIMHAQLDTPGGLTLMASDTPSFMEYREGSNFSVALSGDDADELTSFWRKLADGGEETMPLGPAPWGGQFGMLTDRFGIPWMVSIAD